MSDSYPINEFVQDSFPSAQSRAESFVPIGSDMLASRKSILLTRNSIFQNPSFSDNASFGQNASFTDNASFGQNASFTNNASFGQNVSFTQQEANVYSSQLEEVILNATNPLPMNEVEQVNVNGIQGYLLNKEVIIEIF